MQTVQTVFPLKVSANGRYFTDSNGNPFFWLGDTQWNLFRSFTMDEAGGILDDRARKGFSVILVMLLGTSRDDKADGRAMNVHGVSPWKNDDPLQPNAAYFDTAETVIRMAAERGIVLVIGIYHARPGAANPIQQNNARSWAMWVGKRFRGFANIIWSMYPQANSDHLPIVRELVAGLRMGDGGSHLISVHPDPSPTSSSVFHGEEWLAFNTIQTFKYVEEIVPMVRYDFGLRPAKPVVMAEGAYEGGIEYGFDVTPIWVRRQAYYSHLAGAYHSYGHNDCWRVEPAWRQALDAPGSRQLSILKNTFTELPAWWNLTPDQSLLAEHDPGKGQLIKLAARNTDNSWAVVYLPSPGSVKVDMERIARSGKVRAHWINPADGGTLGADLSQQTGAQSFFSPAQWEDALLLLRGE
jgi:hypothetical protein